MTSPANQQTPIPATTTNAPTATSYASAAGAPKKSAQAPVVAPTSNAPLVVGSSAQPAQNAKAASSPSPVNGKQAVPPAVPAVARGSFNGSGPEHLRKGSVTMAANGPSGYVANGGSIGGAKSGIQFGYDSPAMGHSTPHVGHSAPIPVPDANNNHRVPSPAHSPAPIPQPSASGGRPPSSLQQPTNQMTFGSLGSDGDRHMRQGSVPPNSTLGNQGTHFRRESNHSVQSDNSRGNFGPQNNRPNRGSFNPHATQFNNQMGFPPNNQFRPQGQNRGMPPPFQPGMARPYPNSPQPARSPALATLNPSLPGTPNMPPATMQPNMAMQNPPAYHYPPPMAAPHQQQTFGFPPQQFGQPMPYYPGGMPYMTPQPGAQAYNQQFAPPTYHQQSHSMSRSPSQPERPVSASQPSQPAIVSSNPGALNSQPKPNSFIKPRKSAAVQIKTLSGEVVDTSTFKQPASPVPSTHQTKTPPVVATSTPPQQKLDTPTHTRTDSQSPSKTAKEIQDELKAKIQAEIKAAAAKAAAGNDTKPKEEEKKEVVEEPKAEVKPEVKPEVKAQPEAAPEVKPEEKKVEPAETKVEVKPEAKPEPQPEAPAKVETPAPEKPAEAAKTEEAPKAEEPTKTAEELADEELDRIIREMEEADAKREAEEEERRKKRDAEKAAAKAAEEANKKTNAEEADRKLREQEREMERLEEEKEKRREAAESGGKSLSVAEALAQMRTGGDDQGKKDESAESVADKLADMSIGDKSADAAGQKEKRVAKPAALNLAPIKTSAVEPPQPSAALQSLKSARFLQVMDQDIYPEGIKSPNPSLNAAVAKKGKTFKYDAAFLLQFQKVFTEQPSLQFGQQIKQLIGDGDGNRSASRGQTPSSARQGSRGGGGFPGGTFGVPTGRTLPPGTTSADRMAIASGTLPRPQVNPMASFQRPGAAFPGSSSMSRTSSQNMRNMPNSPRQSSRSTRGSRRNDNAAKEAQAAKTMPLTAGMEVKPITVSATGWKASSLGKAPTAAPVPGPGQLLDPETVQRKVKAALNKMTPEKFDRIADQILVIASQSKDESDGRTLRQVIQLTFEKATDEAHWASMYAKFCKRMLETMSPDIRDENIKDKNGNVVSGGNLFRKYLLNRCQEEFERGWTSNLPEAPEEDDKKTAEAAMLSDEYYAAAAAKRRGLGLVQFIGELFKLGMLTERIMHECVHKLVDYKGIPDEAEIESLCKLLRTIGANLDETDKGRPMMDIYFQRIQGMADLPELQSRMRFMLMDVIDLRRARWVSKEANKGPKTLDEVRAEAEAAQAAKAQEAARTTQRGGPGGRPPVGRGDARNFSGNFSQPVSNQVGMDDLRRLKGSSVNRTSSSNVTLGPASMLSSRSNSGRRFGPGGALGRPGDDSNSSSRAGTPGPTSSNAFSLLATMDNDHPGSPPSAGPSPLMSKAVPASDKKDNE
ncbi:MIF4G domain-containing protein [Trichoderma simmonsii]|uniref:MIF4G domain-containing protein n=1 Tax=Trichoderma simmonsii TaxID=1491479 RepID=A0A8G0LET1_9HYPO|nr:MIF4G domain-containing protein [Trichoderma simmonsii]